MRTTLDIDEDILQAAKTIADRQRTSTGRALSALARQALRASDTASEVRNGVPLLPKRRGERPVTLESIDRLRDSE